MTSRRNPFGLLLFLFVLAVAMLAGTPGTPAADFDTGPPAFELVTYPPELVPVLGVGTVSEPVEGLHVYFAELLRVEIPTAPHDTEHARCESGRMRPGVARCPIVVDLERHDWILSDRTTSNPLRC